MKFEGYFSVDTHGKIYKGSIFKSEDKVIVFDMDGVLTLQKGNYENGKRNGADKYQQHSQAKKVLQMALQDFNKVVLWSLSPKVLDLEGFPYNEVDQRIVGAQFLDVEGNLDTVNQERGDYIKNLAIINKNLENVVAIEDGDNLFFPRERVISIRPHENLEVIYGKAKKLVWKKGQR